MPHPSAPFDGGGVQAVNRQLFAHLFQHPQFHLAQRAIGGGDITGQRIGGFIQPFRQGIADQAEQGRQPVFLFKQVKHRLRDKANAVVVVVGKDWQMMYNALNGHQFGCAHLLVSRRNRNHHGNQRIGRRHRGRRCVRHGSSFRISP